MADCTQEEFLKHVEKHEMTVLQDSGIYRHLHFMAPKSSNQWFAVTTWDDHLCVSGDMGCYVFSRVFDMFKFFREADVINPYYWGQKLQSISRCEGFEKFSFESFQEAIRDTFEEWEFDNDEQKAEVLEDVKWRVLGCDSNEIRAYDAASDYKSAYGHEFTDFWEANNNEYTYHYLWCLRAIVWAIGQYDKGEK